jgi:sulfur carrier protein
VISLRVNGKPIELESPTPLLEYVATLGVDRRAIAVEVNGQILERDGYQGCTLQDGDTVEIVRMVGGGAFPTPCGGLGGGSSAGQKAVAGQF